MSCHVRQIKIVLKKYSLERAISGLHWVIHLRIGHYITIRCHYKSSKFELCSLKLKRDVFATAAVIVDFRSWVWSALRVWLLWNVKNVFQLKIKPL